MEDLLSTPAFVFLAQQVAAGAVSVGAAEAYKLKFSELYRATHANVEREKDAVAKARDLRNLVREEQIALEKAKIRKEQLDALNEQAESQRRKLAVQLAELESRETSMQQETNELKLHEQGLIEDVAKMKRDNENTVLPALSAAAAEIAEAKGDHARAAAHSEQLLATKHEMHQRLGEMDVAVSVATNTAAAMHVEASRVKDEPVRAMKVVESVRTATRGVNDEMEKLRHAIDTRTAEMEEQNKATEEIARVREELDGKLGRYLEDVEAREAEVGGVARTLRSERTQYKDLLERRIELQAEDVAASAAARTAENERDSGSAAYERGKRELKRKMDAANEAIGTLPGLQAIIDERMLEQARLTREGLELEAALAATKRETDLAVAAFMKEEGVERKQREAFAEAAEVCRGLEAEKERWHKEEMLAHKQVSALKAQRDLKSREAATTANSRRVTIEMSKMKELHLIDLTKQLGDINTRLRQFAALYEVVKAERNTFATSIQAASQSLAEMRERIKILSSEVDILKNEVKAKEKGLFKEQQALDLAAKQRDALRTGANKAAVDYRRKQGAVESQIMSIDKTNSVINTLEREMLALKKKYEDAVEMRNYTGIQLIDRNDELCILYEKSNIHDKTLADGETALRVMTEEIRALRISISEIERQLHLARSQFPETPMWAERILELQRQLVQARQVSEKLCVGLEAPSSSDRWTELAGADPSADTLKSRIARLEERLNAVREELLEKDLVLEEVAGLTERLKTTAAAVSAPALGEPAAAAGAGGGSGSVLPTRLVDPPGLAAAKQASELQSRIKDTNRRMMAVVSELSMYQATSIKLAAEASAATEELARAEAAAAKGLAPTVAADQRWQATARAMTVAPGAAAVRPDAAALEAPKTTAEARPNAYIPDGIGLPKPYGEFQPFKPSESGAIMRHFRAPEAKEIEI